MKRNTRCAFRDNIEFVKWFPHILHISYKDITIVVRYADQLTNLFGRHALDHEAAYDGYWWIETTALWCYEIKFIRRKRIVVFYFKNKDDCLYSKLLLE